MSLGASLAEFFNEQLGEVGIDTSPLIGEIIVSIMIFAIFIILGWIVYRIFERYFTKWAKKTKTNLDDEILANIKKPIYFFVILVGAYYGLEFLSILEPYSTEVAFTFSIVEILLIAFIITRVVNVVITWYGEKRAKKQMSEHILFVLKKIINAVVYLFAFLVILAVLKIDLSGIVVGLGVGGIAIAFALQNVLSDVFSAFSIYFDKPFEIFGFLTCINSSVHINVIGIVIQLVCGNFLNRFFILGFY